MYSTVSETVKMKKLACLLLAALLLFCFSGCEEGIPTAGSTPSSDLATSEKSYFDIPGTLSAENFDLTIVSAKVSDTVTLDSGIEIVIEPDEGKQFLILCIDAKNTSGEIRNLGNFFSYADGFTVLPHNILGKFEDRVLFGGGVHPGKTICTYILYQVPTDLQEFEMAYQDSLTGSISDSIVIARSEIE